jgi:hypothetical protein
MYKSLYLCKGNCDNQVVKIAFAWMDFPKVQGDELKNKINSACPLDK